MNWLDLCIPLVAGFEGCAKKVGGMIHPYLDKLAKPNVWTRGYGRTYGIAEDSPPITPDEAKSELGVGLQQYAKKILVLSPVLANHPNMLAAVTSWAWNCGTGAYKVSRLRKAVNDGRWEDVVERIKKPNTAGGVVFKGLERRRQAEAKLAAAGLDA